MRLRDVVIGFIFLVILIAGSWWILKNRNKTSQAVPLSTPNITEKINKTFPNLTIPQGADRADLNGVNGSEGVGVATRQKNNNVYVITVMANVPDLEKGEYIAEISDNNNKITLGKLSVTKSGYLVNFSSTLDLQNYKKVTVSENGNVVLEGGF